MLLLLLLLVLLSLFHSDSSIPLMWMFLMLLPQLEYILLPRLHSEYVVVIIKAAWLLCFVENHCMCPFLFCVPITVAVKLSSFSNPLVQCELSQLWDLLGVVFAVYLWGADNELGALQNYGELPSRRTLILSCQWYQPLYVSELSCLFLGTD